MKNIMLLLICMFLIFFSNIQITKAQNDTITKTHIDSVNKENISSANNDTTDDEFNLFLFTYAAAFMCAIIVASFIGAIAAIIIVLFIFVMVSAGIFSTSLVIGLYKKSFAAGFKTFLIIAGMITGVILGAVALWIATRFFHLSLSYTNSLIIGAAGGCLGGIIIGLVLYKALQLITSYFKKKLKLTL